MFKPCLCKHAVLYPCGTYYCEMTEYPDMQIADRDKIRMCVDFVSGMPKMKTLDEIIKNNKIAQNEIKKKTLKAEPTPKNPAKKKVEKTRLEGF